MSLHSDGFEVSDAGPSGWGPDVEFEDLEPEDQDQLQALEDEIKSVSEQITQLSALRRSLEQQRSNIYQNALKQNKSPTAAKKAATRLITTPFSYDSDDFEWSRAILQRARQVFGIEDFRACQKGACNAALDGRDIVTIMATGAGKSLCYQLPAIMAGSKMTTLVVSPLISLMHDQAMHLREAGVECELLSAANSQEETKAIMSRVRSGGNMQDGSPITILFVTPERVAKSKTFMAAVQQCYERGQLARIVIDEAHCASSQGHDFRPDYKKLSILRKLFPSVPIMCLTATCGPAVLADLLSILGLPPTTDPHAAAPGRTVYFKAPLFRSNLFYSVRSRPASAKDAVKAIADWIMEKHDNESGIVYCLSKKDTQTMADSLKEISNGKIKVGVYHSDMEDASKHQVHVRWREGKIKVVCATIAFGMGIDKDATRLSSLVAGEPTGQVKMNAMLAYSQSTECRKLIFASYFQDDMLGNTDPCGNCDNCLSRRETQDVSFAAWQIAKVVTEIHAHEGRLTLAGLADLVRGLGGGKYTISSEGRGKKSKAGAAGIVNLDALIGGKVEIAKDNVERIIVTMLLEGYLADWYSQTGWAVNVYVQPGIKTIRLTRHALQEAKSLQGMLKVAFVNGSDKSKRGKKKKDLSSSKSSASTSRKNTGKAKGKAGAGTGDSESDLDEDSFLDSEDEEDRIEDWMDDEEEEGSSNTAAKRKKQSPSEERKKRRLEYQEEDEDEEDMPLWEVLGGQNKKTSSGPRVSVGTSSKTAIAIDSD